VVGVASETCRECDAEVRCAECGAEEPGYRPGLATVPHRLRATLASGHTMREVASAVGMSTATIHKMVHGGDPRLSTLVALDRYLSGDAR
jgi:hypothetical protein